MSATAETVQLHHSADASLLEKDCNDNANVLIVSVISAGNFDNVTIQGNVNTASHEFTDFRLIYQTARIIKISRSFGYNASFSGIDYYYINVFGDFVMHGSLAPISSVLIYEQAFT